MGDLVPERRTPVELSLAAARGAVHGHQVPERHAQEADAGQSQGPDGKVVVLRIELHDHILLKFELVALGEGLNAVGDQVGDVGIDDRRFVLVEAQEHCGRGGGFTDRSGCFRGNGGGGFPFRADLPLRKLAPQDHKVVETVEQPERVDRLRAEGIALVGQRQVRLRLLDAVLAKQVDAQFGVGGPQIRLDAHRLEQQFDGLPVAPVDEVVVGRRGMDLAVGRVIRQGPIGPFAGGDALQHVRRRMQRVNLQRRQILCLGDRKRLVQSFPGVIDRTVLKAQPRRDQVSFQVPPVTIQNLLHDGPGAVLEAAQGDRRDTEPGRRIVLVQVQRLREQPRGLVRLVGRQEQPSPALPDGKGLRIELQGGTEKGIGGLKVAEPPGRLGADGAVEALRGDLRVAGRGGGPLAAVVLLVAGLQHGIAAGGIVERLGAD